MPRIARVTVPSSPPHACSTSLIYKPKGKPETKDVFLTCLEKSIGKFLKPEKSGRKPMKNKEIIPKLKDEGDTYGYE